MILVINFGGQYSHLIARRVRELGVKSEIAPYDISASQVKNMKPAGIILSGGPSSVYDEGAPIPDRKLLELGIPVLGICYGLQLIAKFSNGKVLAGKLKEFGKKTLKVKKTGKLLKGLSRKEQIWMSHGDLVEGMPKVFTVLASTDSCPVAAFEDNGKKLYGIQFHAEVVHTPKGMRIFRNFVFDICRAKKDWSIKDLQGKLISGLKKEIGNNSVIMGVSGGVDSTVAATLLHRAIGDRLYCVFIDHGLIRKGEKEEVTGFFESKLRFRHFYFIDASNKFLEKLKGVTDPEEKRKIIGHTFIEAFEEKVLELEKKHPGIKFLGQGTIYPDRIESAQPSKEASKIKSHHNLTLPERMKLKVVEPLREFYKDEVRKLGSGLKIPESILNRHPFPGPGLAIRILGEITPERLRILREADYIFIDTLRKFWQYDKVWQAFAALLPVKSVGVMGDARTYDYVISLRAVTSVDGMTADWARIPDVVLEIASNRIINEVRGVNRVLYDISQKPPSTIEYE
ncbi:glutamine-hydrolyzing GMP synthase [Candidatus Woesearchaeota archaeon]|nr:glutamine-hydrolyzing GMP synthase [Candidatus Woesearchaeota archaeon]